MSLVKSKPQIESNQIENTIESNQLEKTVTNETADDDDGVSVG